MALDVRLPLGLLFLVTGAMLTAFILLTRGSAIYEKSLFMNINLVRGLILVAFGLFMLLLAWTGRRGSAAPDAATSAGDAPDRPASIH